MHLGLDVLQRLLGLLDDLLVDGGAQLRPEDGEDGVDEQHLQQAKQAEKRRISSQKSGLMQRCASKGKETVWAGRTRPPPAAAAVLSRAGRAGVSSGGTICSVPRCQVGFEALQDSG